MKHRWLIGSLIVVAFLGVAPTASATSCQSWRRMSEDQRWNRVYRMIDDAIAGHGGRDYQVNRAAIARCLESQVESMYWEFDDVCADPQTARSTAIRKIFKHYIWSCVR